MFHVGNSANVTALQSIEGEGARKARGDRQLLDWKTLKTSALRLVVTKVFQK